MKLQIRSVQAPQGLVMILCKEDGTAFGLQERTSLHFEKDDLARFTVTFAVENEGGDITLAPSEPVA
jgi:hypothetical protein